MSTKPAISIDRETTTEALSLEAVPAPRVSLETTVLAPRVPVDTFLLYLVSYHPGTQRMETTMVKQQQTTISERR